MSINVYELNTKYVLFTGKGGVGKTTISCATAIKIADSGKKVLLVSTDPASNLDEVLNTTLGTNPRNIPGVTGLDALNIDPDKVATEYKERTIGPYREMLPKETIASMEEQLSGSCTTEIATFDVFTQLLSNESIRDRYDNIIFDTAPTGHTLRLLSLPKAWTSFLETNTTGTSCLGPLSGLENQKEAYQSTLSNLMNGESTTLVLVSRPELPSLREAERTNRELEELGISNQILLLNGVFKADNNEDSLARALEKRCQIATENIPPNIYQLPRMEVPLCKHPLLGISAVRAIFDSGMQIDTNKTVVQNKSNSFMSLKAIIDELEKMGSGVIMTMGKGGVGKTSVASQIATELARRGHSVHLNTTDPAAHVSWYITEPLPNLEIGLIDPEKVTEQYRTQVLNELGDNLDDQGKRLLSEDLRSPCTEEIAVFKSFSQIVEKGQNKFVVLDTAPTGHTILLLDTAESYHRDVERQSSDMPDSVRSLLPRLRDQLFTRILLVTLPEATPVHEAMRLETDLERAGIRPYSWIINQSLTPLKTTDSLLRRRQNDEMKYIEEVKMRGSRRIAMLPWRDQN